MVGEEIPENLRNALEDFESRIEQILTSFTEKINAVQAPQIIYHYTNDAGLKGILESGKIWLSDVFSLNDPSELRHGFSIFIEALESKAANAPDPFKLFTRTMRTSLERIRESATYFACSLSATGDDLGQWRAYADNGQGFAIGFDAQKLERSFVPPGTSQSVSASFPVTYDDAQLRKIHREIVDQVLGFVSVQCDGADILKLYLAELGTLAASHAMHASLFFKHSAYENEKEYRFLKVFEISDPIVGIKARMRPYNLTKYIEFDWRAADPKTLRSIVVGPAANWTTASRFANDCLDTFHPQNISLFQSGIPYRSR